jgi:hypothetical protein
MYLLLKVVFFTAFFTQNSQKKRKNHFPVPLFIKLIPWGATRAHTRREALLTANYERAKALRCTLLFYLFSLL